MQTDLSEVVRSCSTTPELATCLALASNNSQNSIRKGKGELRIRK